MPDTVLGARDLVMETKTPVCMQLAFSWRETGNKIKKENI